MRCSRKDCDGVLGYVQDTIAKKLPYYTFSLNTRIQCCRQCGNKYFSMQTLEKLELRSAEWIVERWFSDTFKYAPRHFQFVRKVLGRDPSSMADLLGVTSSTIAHWERSGRVDFRSLLVTSLALVDYIKDRRLESFYHWETFQAHNT